MKYLSFLTALAIGGAKSSSLAAATALLPENLALHARATASSEHNNRYVARFAVDGRIPAAGSQADLDQAWCVQGNTHRNGAEFALEWTNEVTVAEIVYYGRTAWFDEDLDTGNMGPCRGSGVATYNGRMIENLHVDNARRILLEFQKSFSVSKGCSVADMRTAPRGPSSSGSESSPGMQLQSSNAPYSLPSGLLRTVTMG